MQDIFTNLQRVKNIYSCRVTLDKKSDHIFYAMSRNVKKYEKNRKKQNISCNISYSNGIFCGCGWSFSVYFSYE